MAVLSSQMVSTHGRYTIDEAISRLAGPSQGGQFQTTQIILAAGFARGLLAISRLGMNEGAGQAGCQPHPMASYAKTVGVVRASFSHHRTSQTSGFPCTMISTAY